MPIAFLSFFAVYPTLPYIAWLQLFSENMEKGSLTPLNFQAPFLQNK